MAVSVSGLRGWNRLSRRTSSGPLFQGRHGAALPSGQWPVSQTVGNPFSCSCPDSASMCKHVAAVLYGVGSRLDEQPELLFRLRAVDHSELVADLDTAVPLSKTAPAAGKVLETDDLSALFGLDLAEEESPIQPGGEAPPELKPPTRGKQPRASKKAAVRTKGGTRQKTAARKEAGPEAIEHPSAKSVRATPDARQRPRRRKPGAVWDPADIYEA